MDNAKSITEEQTLKYTFYYYFNLKDEEQQVDIYASDTEEAVLKFYDTIGLAEFGCIVENGKFFSDVKFEHLKELIKNGC